ncbi:MAG: sigma-54-dependent Fis family transcriptional regulator [Magnetococcus sp. WYHC-3]
MSEQLAVYKRLNELQVRLDEVNRAWTGVDHEALMSFFVDVMPQIMNAERASIFVNLSNEETIWLKFGTGLQERKIEAPRQGSVVGTAITSGRTLIRNNLLDEDGFHRQADRLTNFITRNMICVPIPSLLGGRCLGALQVLNKREGEGFGPDDEMVVQRVVRYLSFAVETTALQARIVELSNLFHEDVELFRMQRLERIRFVTKSQKMRDLVNVIHQVSAVPVNVFLSGESGTGKEIVSRIIHNSSDRRNGPLVAVNCSTIPENLMESEFFGHERGAFTGAAGSRAGRFEEATGGTLFLDEVADMPLSIQPKFLRAIQESEGQRLGSNKTRRYDFRIITASCKDLRREVEAGRFREDLFFRLYSVEIHIPPLRERREDIVPLSLNFLEEVCRRFNKNVQGFSPEVLDLFENYSWPGNVRQLQHEIERLVALTPVDSLLLPDKLSPKLLGQMGVVSGSDRSGTEGYDLAEHRRQVEVSLIRKVLKITDGNKIKAAKLLGVTRQSLYNKMRQYQME